MIPSISTENVLSYEPEIIIDQFQENASYKQDVHKNIIIAQSFTPSLSPLTKIDIRLNKPGKTDLPLIISIKKSLNGSTLTSKVIPADDIPFFSHWITTDIADIDVIPGDTYYIVVSTSSPSEKTYQWYYDFSTETDPYPGGKLYRSINSGDTWEQVETHIDFVDASFRTYSYVSHTNMICEGYLNWTNVKPAQDNLTGFFTIQNNGTPYSKLNWKILNWPSWGTWHFSQMNGSDLCPEDGLVTVTIDVIAPDINMPDQYLGKIVIVNEDDSNETCIISARLVTNKSKSSNIRLIDVLLYRRTGLNAIFETFLFFWHF